MFPKSVKTLILVLLVSVLVSVPAFSVPTQTSFTLDLSNPVFNFTENAFNDSSLSKILSVNATNNATVYISIPKNSTMNSAYFNFTPVVNYCYQESANTTNQSGSDGNCALNYTGVYANASAFTNLNNSYDGDWDTYGLGTTTSSYFYINYTKPQNAVNALWQIKYGSGGYKNVNLTINGACWSQDATKLMLRVFAYQAGASVTGYCYNGTGWKNLTDDQANVGTGAIYEEGVFWNVPNYSVYINDTLDSSGLVNGTVNLNVTKINNWLVNNCTSSMCSVPIVFSSSGDGSINVSSLNFSYSYNVSNLLAVLKFWNKTNIAMNEFISQNKNITYSSPVFDINITGIKVNSGADSCSYNGVAGVTHPTYCYQETANVSTVCGGLSTGSYKETYDSSGSVFINYTKPANVTEAVWLVKHGSDNYWGAGNTAPYNITLPTGCWNTTTIQLKFVTKYYYSPTPPFYKESTPYCYNTSSSSWVPVGTSIAVTDGIYSNGGNYTKPENIWDGNWSTQTFEAIYYGNYWTGDAPPSDASVWEEAMQWKTSYDPGVCSINSFMWNATTSPGTLWDSTVYAPVVSVTNSRVQDSSKTSYAGNNAQVYSVYNVTLIDNESSYGVTGTSFNVSWNTSLSGWTLNSTSGYATLLNANSTIPIGANKTGMIALKSGTGWVQNADYTTQAGGLAYIKGKMVFNNTDSINYDNVHVNSSAFNTSISRTSNNWMYGSCAARDNDGVDYLNFTAGTQNTTNKYFMNCSSPLIITLSPPNYYGYPDWKTVSANLSFQNVTGNYSGTNYDALVNYTNVALNTTCPFSVLTCYGVSDLININTGNWLKTAYAAGDGLNETWSPLVQDNAYPSVVNGNVFIKRALNISSLENIYITFNVSIANDAGNTTRSGWTCDNMSSFNVPAYGNSTQARVMWCNKTNVIYNTTGIGNYAQDLVSHPWFQINEDTQLYLLGEVAFNATDDLVSYTNVEFNATDPGATPTMNYINFTANENASVKNVSYTIPITAASASKNTICGTKQNTQFITLTSVYPRGLTNIKFMWPDVLNNFYYCSNYSLGCVPPEDYCVTNGYTNYNYGIAGNNMTFRTDLSTKYFLGWYPDCVGTRVGGVCIPASTGTPGGGGSGAGVTLCPAGQIFDSVKKICVQANIEMNPSAFVFEVTPGQSMTEPLTIKNLLGEDIDVKFEPAVTWAIINPLTKTIKKGEVGNFTVSVSAPYTPGTYEGSFKIYVNNVLKGNLPVTLKVSEVGAVETVTSLLFGKEVGVTVNDVMGKTITQVGDRKITFAAIFVAATFAFAFVMWTRQSIALAYGSGLIALAVFAVFFGVIMGA